MPNPIVRRRMMGYEIEFYRRAMALFGGNVLAYLPLWEPSGTVINDISGRGRNGAYGAGVAAPTLGQSGIGDGRTATYFDGGDYGNIYSAGLVSDFSPLAGSLIVFWKPDLATQWTDSTVRGLLNIAVDSGSNLVSLRKGNSDYGFQFFYIAGGASSTVTVYATFTNWAMLAVTWDKASDTVNGFQNGVLRGSGHSMGDWSGTPAATRCVIGGTTTTPGLPIIGSLGHAVILNRAATQSELRELAQLLGYQIIGVIGDSISDTHTDYPMYLANGYNSGRATVINHAVGGMGIVYGASNMAVQVAAAANDDDNIIILALGTNDDNAGDMVALRAAVESGITTLRGTNPRARLYYMNVLPRWTDATGAMIIDRSNIRTAIAAACAAQNVVCWDTYTVPWIAASDTSDGTHPTSAGAQKIATAMLSRL